MKSIIYTLLLFIAAIPAATAQTRDCVNTPIRENFNVLHYDLDISFDTLNNTLSGIVKIKADLVKDPAVPFQIDLQEPLVINKVVYGNLELELKKEKDKYFVQVPDLVEGETFVLAVHYSGVPKAAANAPWDGGMVRTKDKRGKVWWAAACQGAGASVWFPCKDINADEPEMGVDLHYTVPSGLTAIGNGRFASVTNAAGNQNTWHWKVISPINIYNITFYIGNYLRIQDVFNGINGKMDLDYFVMNENYQVAKEHLKAVPPMLTVFEDWMGAYPFHNDGFKIVEAPYLGMEHQSAIAYGNNYQMGYLGKDRSKTGVGMLFDFILVHETGHEWFGNGISILDPAYFWINEGFTSYTEIMYIESVFGKEKAIDYLIGTRSLIKNKAPMQGALGQCQNTNTDCYPKAANLVHMVRKLMKDDEAFKGMIRKMNNDFARKVITGPEMESFIAKETALDLQKVFEQYLRHKELPTLRVKRSKKGFSYKWEKCVPGFNMPVLAVINGEEKWLYPTTKEQSHLQAEVASFAVQKEFYCALTLE
ncbi:MAG: hypothetical protein BGO31_04620 [Bacteroidetes bacterium 43-16]|nr:MAG: hypothetical protein BGO31_04620 [Bacteroidetes bacterium 43-16]